MRLSNLCYICSVNPQEVRGLIKKKHIDKAIFILKSYDYEIYKQFDLDDKWWIKARKICKILN